MGREGVRPLCGLGQLVLFDGRAYELDLSVYVNLELFLVDQVAVGYTEPLSCFFDLSELIFQVTKSILKFLRLKYFSLHLGLAISQKSV